MLETTAKRPDQRDAKKLVKMIGDVHKTVSRLGVDLQKIMDLASEINDDVSSAARYFEDENVYGDVELVGGYKQEIVFYNSAENLAQDILDRLDDAVDGYSDFLTSLRRVDDASTELDLDF